MYIKNKIIDQIGILTIDRQDALNAMNPIVLKELDSSFKNLVNDKDVGVIIITGAGEKAFVAGADIKLMQNFNTQEALDFWKIRSRSDHVNRTFIKTCFSCDKWLRIGRWM